MSLVKFKSISMTSQREAIKDALHKVDEQGGMVPGVQTGRVWSYKTARIAAKKILDSLEVSAQQADKTTTAKNDWMVEKMIRQYDVDGTADQLLTATYANNPDGTIKTAIRLVRPGLVGSYIPCWLGTLGPALASRLDDFQILQYCVKYRRRTIMNTARVDVTLSTIEKTRFQISKSPSKKKVFSLIVPSLPRY